MRNFFNMRKNYEKGELTETDAGNTPLHIFERWFDEAVKKNTPEPNAMTVATVNTQGQPSTRIVLMKSFDTQGIVWYTNYNSRKGQEIAQNPHAALQFHWVELERVVRIEGIMEKVSPQESDTYFQQRPLDSRIGAWASPQSQIIPNRLTLIENAAKYGAKFMLAPPRPDHWGGYRLIPHSWEFWQGRKSRLHDRLHYTLNEQKQWQRERLAP